MAGNSRLRVIRIENGSLLDSEALETLARMAAERDHQVWIERVDESGKIGFAIEDGSVASVDGRKVESAAKPEAAPAKAGQGGQLFDK